MTATSWRLQVGFIRGERGIGKTSLAALRLGDDRVSRHLDPVIPISGELGDLFGRKRFVQIGVVGLLVASALFGMAQSMPQLIVGRAVHRIFGGLITSSAVASMAVLRGKGPSAFAHRSAVSCVRRAHPPRLS